MNTFVTIQVNRVRNVSAATRGLSIDVEMTGDQLVAAFSSFIQNTQINDAQAAALVERIQAELTA